MDWLSIIINGALVIWVASLQIKANQNNSADENYDPVVKIKKVSKKLGETFKPFIVSALLTVGSSIALYFELLNEDTISRITILKISLLSSFLFANIVLMISTWHRARGYKLATKLITDLTGAFQSKKSVD